MVEALAPPVTIRIGKLRTLFLRQVADRYGTVADMTLAQLNHQPAQITNVARIVPSHQIVPHRRFEVRRLTIRSDLAEEMTGERQDVFSAFIQSRQSDDPARDAVVEIPPEGPGLDFVEQVTMGGTDEPELRLVPRVAADSLVSSFLYDAQQLRLQAQR